MKFKNIYHFEVINKITEGKTVYIFDRFNKSIKCANEMKVKELMAVLEEIADDKNNRFDVWIEETEETTEEKAE